MHMPLYGLATRTLPPPHLTIKQLVLWASSPHSPNSAQGPGKCCSHCAATRDYNTPMAQCSLALIPGDNFEDDEDSSACSVDSNAEGGPAGGLECSRCHARKTWSTHPPTTQLASRNSLFPSFPPFTRHVPLRPPRPTPL
ncbi:hypothetical protein B0H14DRAFT_3481719 [Mycena olivaceomarginata]|nr:hypothetical protein B0H14DRAFT_3481719 [Mycena olivaceomarginata]